MDLKLVWIATQRHPIGRPDSGFTGATPFPANGDGWITKRTPPRARFFCPGIESTPLPPGNSDPGGDESIGGCPETSRKMAPPFPTAFGETTPGSRSLANSFDLSLQFRQIHSSLKLEIFFSGKNHPPYFPSSYFLSFAYFFFFSFYSFLFIYFFFKYAITSIHPALKENFYYRWDKFFRSERVRREMLSKMESITERNSTNVVHLRWNEADNVSLSSRSFLPTIVVPPPLLPPTTPPEAYLPPLQPSRARSSFNKRSSELGGVK